MLWTWRSVGDYSVTSALTPYLCAPGSAVSHGPFFSGHLLGPSHTQVSPCALPMDTWPFGLTVLLHFHSIHTCTHNRELALGKQIEMEFNKKTGHTLLIRAEHSQTSLLTSPLFTHSQTNLYQYAFIFLHQFLAFVSHWDLWGLLESVCCSPCWVSG